MRVDLTDGPRRNIVDVHTIVTRGGPPGDLSVLGAAGPEQAVNRPEILALVARRDAAAVETTAAASRCRPQRRR